MEPMRAAAAATAKLDPERTPAVLDLVGLGEEVVEVPVFEPVVAEVMGGFVVMVKGVVTPVAPVVPVLVMGSAWVGS